MSETPTPPAADGSTFAAVRACAIALLAGIVLHASDVTAGNGKIIDWRTVRCGETLQEGGDAFDTAQLFVTLVGPDAALASVAEEAEISDAPEAHEPAPEVFAYKPDQYGNRLRQIDVGIMRIRVEVLPWLCEGRDAEAESFAERLAALCAEVAS